MRVIIDRFEEDKAVIEVDGEMLTVPRALFEDAHEGDHIEITVLGRPHNESEITEPDDEDEAAPDFSEDAESAESPRLIFERLRSRRKRRSPSPDSDHDHEKHVDKC